MKKLAFLFLLACQIISGQSVGFVEINDTLQKPKYQEFIYLNPNIDFSGSVRVATLKSVGSQDNPVLLYNLIKTAAQKIGANSFRLVKFDKYEDQTAELTLAVFYTNDSILGSNYKTIPKNRVYILGKDDLISTNTDNFKVDDDVFSVSAGHFLMFDLLPGEEMVVKKSSKDGVPLLLKGEGGKSSRFFSFSKPGLREDQYGETPVSDGRLNPVEQNLALLLIKMYEEQK
jgi:hypothetical protein